MAKNFLTREEYEIRRFDIFQSFGVFPLRALFFSNSAWSEELNKALSAFDEGNILFDVKNIDDDILV